MCENWRKLSSVGGIDLRGIAWGTHLDRDHVAFAPEMTDSLPFDIVQSDRPDLLQFVTNTMEAFQPDLILVAGWGVNAYRRALSRQRQGTARIVMGMDTPWQGRLQQYFARYALRPFLSRVDAVLTAGERSADYARRLGFSSDRIFRGLYSWDENLRTRCALSRESKRHQFLMVGRYVPEKGIVTLLDAYRKYRNEVENPWDLVCCGSGPLKPMLTGQPGVHDLGFVLPSELPNQFARSSVFVLPSHFEPWGVAIAEAMGCGLPVIVSDECGAAADLIEPGVSGFIVKAGSSDELHDRMMECHANPETLVEVGRNASASADRFTSTQWATRFQGIIDQFIPVS